MLLKAFCKYQFGVFDEDGFLYDNLYPAAYVDGNSTVGNHGCTKDSQMKLFCPLGMISIFKQFFAIFGHKHFMLRFHYGSSINRVFKVLGIIDPQPTPS